MKNFNNCCLCGNQVWNNYWENFLDNWLHPLWRHDNSFYMFPPARNMKESRHQHDYIRWQANYLDLVVHLLSASHLDIYFFSMIKQLNFVLWIFGGTFWLQSCLWWQSCSNSYNCQCMSQQWWTERLQFPGRSGGC